MAGPGPVPTLAAPVEVDVDWEAAVGPPEGAAGGEDGVDVVVVWRPMLRMKVVIWIRRFEIGVSFGFGVLRKSLSSEEYVKYVLELGSSSNNEGDD